MEFSEEKLFDVNTTNEEIEEQIKLFLGAGGTGQQLVRMIMLNPIKGIAGHTTRILDIIKGMDFLPGIDDKRLL